MQLTQMIIRRETYGDSKGQLKGSVEFTAPHGKIELPLDDRLSQEVVRLCSEGITRMSRQIAEDLTADVVEGTLALPAE